MRSVAILLALLALTPSALGAALTLDVLPLGATPVAAGERAPAKPAPPAPPPPAAPPIVLLARALPVATEVDTSAIAELVPEALPPAPVRLATDPHGAKFERLERRAAVADLPRAAVDAASAPLVPEPAAPGEMRSSARPAAPDPAPHAAGEPAPPPRAAGTRATPAAAAPATGLALGVALYAGALYHRLRGAAVIEHGARAKIAELLRAEPGLTPAEIARRTSVDPSTALYHLRRMVKEGVILCEGERRASRYFAPGSVAPADRARVVVAREAAPVLDAIRAQPGVSKSRLALRLAIARTTLAWHLRRLERAGIVRCERAGREVRVFPA